jgi:ABC-type bacteriocin/lantibiotic exporter with double-glycine peptidase domain
LGWTCFFEKDYLNHDITKPIEVEIKNLNFAYPGRTKAVIKNVSYRFEANNSYCITGSNGSGKSTLIHLISGLYQAQSGMVCINELPIHNYNISLLYKVIGNGLVEETIFEGTLMENITLGRDFISIEDVIWAAEKVYLSAFVKELPKGFDTIIDMEDRLSKSIIQRIIIARSIVNKPKLILLENHIDFIEEIDRNKIIDFLTNKSNGWTLISISNNNYLQQKSDTVIMMNDGEIS